VRGPTVLVCGHVTTDHLAGGICAGGSAYYAGRALAGLGALPRIFTAAGPDFPRGALEGIEAHLAPAAATTSFVNTYEADGARTQRVLAAAPPLDPARLPSGWRSPDVLLLAPVLSEIDVGAFAAAAAARLVGLCVQGLVREVAADGAVRARPLPLDEAALSAVGAAVVGEDEARGSPGLVARLAGTIPVVAFTQGARGCEVMVRGRVRRVGVHPAREVDPTGAGDVFAAAFFLGLARGEDPLDAARLGAAAASVAIEGHAGESLVRVGEAFARAARVPILG
jgi:sugar/nucleoside kinase (ribokinase family)